MRSLATVILLLLGTSLYASYDDAVKLFEAKKYSESLKMLGDELVTADDFKADSPNYKIRFLAAHNHWKLGNGESVVLHLKRCMEIKKNSADPYIDLSLYLLETKRYADATAWAEKGLSLGDNAMLYYILGRASREKGNLARAKELLEKCNSLNPELYFSYNELGLTLMKMGRYGEANTAFSVAGALKPDSAQICNNLALSFERIGKGKEALESITKANELDKANTVISANLSRIKGNVK